MKIWLDDVRPAPDGWLHVRTAQEARDAVEKYYNEGIVEMSLDHDLGICPKCTPGQVVGNIVIMETLEAACKKGCSCDCHETGYDFVCWMEETDLWPKNKPRVHSVNPAGAAKMRAAINRRYY